MTGLNVKIWMMKKPLTATEIAEGYGSSASFVSQFLRGNKTSQKLVDFLTDEGCPKKHFKNGKVAA